MEILFKITTVYVPHPVALKSGDQLVKTLADWSLLSSQSQPATTYLAHTSTPFLSIRYVFLKQLYHISRYNCDIIFAYPKLKINEIYYFNDYSE
jgi:hypothetical protein